MRHIHACSLMVVLFGLNLTHHAAAQPDAAEPATVDAALGDVLANYVMAINERNYEALAQSWTPNGTHIDRETGIRTEGRDQIIADLRTALEESPQLRVAASLDHVQSITDDVVRVEGETTVSLPEQDPAQFVFSAVMVRQNDQWQIATIEEAPLPTLTSPQEQLQELSWMIGRWVDEGDGVRVDTTVRWSNNQAFLLRSFAVTADDAAPREGTQIIGWDPRAQQIRSWSFNADGSFGEGTWSKNGASWLVKSTQTLADGGIASGTYVITPESEETVVMELVGHQIDGHPEPAPQPVTMVRVPAEEDGDVPPTN